MVSRSSSRPEHRRHQRQRDPAEHVPRRRVLDRGQLVHVRRQRPPRRQQDDERLADREQAHQDDRRARVRRVGQPLRRRPAEHGQPVLAAEPQQLVDRPVQRVEQPQPQQPVRDLRHRRRQHRRRPRRADHRRTPVQQQRQAQRDQQSRRHRDRREHHRVSQRGPERRIAARAPRSWPSPIHCGAWIRS